MSQDTHDITRLLEEWRCGNRDAAARLIELVYHELHRMAQLDQRAQRRGPSGVPPVSRPAKI